jgi:hypothetical protein
LDLTQLEDLWKKTFSTFADGRFLEGATHLERWKTKGRILKSQTIGQHRRHLVNYLIPRFGRLTLDKIRPAAGCFFRERIGCPVPPAIPENKRSLPGGMARFFNILQP